MATTSWSYPWSSVWGGVDEPDPGIVDPPLPILPLEEKVGGSLWLAQDGPGTGVASTGPLVGGDTIGWAPRNMGEYDEPGGITVASYADGPALTTLRILRSDHGHGVVIRTGWAQAA